MADPNLNPNQKLEHILRDPANLFPIKAEHSISICFDVNPPPYLDASLEGMRYVKRQVFPGEDEFATIQIFGSVEDARRHWTGLRSLDSNVFMRPQHYVPFRAYHVLMFDDIVRDFRVWLNAHANPLKGRVSDETLWKIIKNILRNLGCMSSQLQRSHGNLEKGIGVTTNLQALFFALGDSNDYMKDVKELKGIIDKFLLQIPVGGDQNIIVRVNRLKAFLSDSCLKPNPIVVTSSCLLPPGNPDHVKLIFNYPAAWNDEECLRFLANMHRLCSDRCKTNGRSNLARNRPFRAKLNNRGYSGWNSRLTSPTLIEVFLFGVNNHNNYIPVNQSKVKVESIVLFAHNCVKHFTEQAQAYNNNLLTPNPAAAGNTAPIIPKHPELTSGEVLQELRRDFRFLIEDVYEAFHEALAGGYKHHVYSTSQILTGRI